MIERILKEISGPRPCGLKPVFGMVTSSRNRSSSINNSINSRRRSSNTWSWISNSTSNRSSCSRIRISNSTSSRRRCSNTWSRISNSFSSRSSSSSIKSMVLRFLLLVCIFLYLTGLTDDALIETSSLSHQEDNIEKKKKKTQHRRFQGPCTVRYLRP